MLFRRTLCGACCAALFASFSAAAAAAPADNGYEIAYMSDVHFHDVYAHFEDGSFKGLPSAKHKNATIRTMYAQLTSTRLFNENYFAFLAALDDAVARGLKVVVISGDFSDDGQPVHMRGLREVMEKYRKQHGLRFFVTMGNHDPAFPFVIPAGKKDYLGDNGKNQPIFSRDGSKDCSGYDTTNAEKNGTICTQEVVHGGYGEIFTYMGQYGLTPQADYVYWETPYSSYKTQADYSFDKASKEAAIDRRSFEICKQGAGGELKKEGYTDCAVIPDGTYLVEPVPGLWLLAVDSNVYLPADLASANPAKRFTGSGNNGWNKMLTHKQHVVAWIKDVAERAKREGKTLSVFSHFPTVAFYRGASAEVAEMFGKGGLDLKREPTASTSERVAETGIGLHFGGHIHANDTAVFNKSGKFLVNVQVPSLAAYVPAYKHVTYQPQGKVDIQTVELKDVPRFNELFEHYRVEHKYLAEKSPAKLWDEKILASRNYAEFAGWHMSELTRLRFLDEKWACDMRQLARSLNGADMLTTALLDTPVTEGQLQQAGKDQANLAACTVAESVTAPTERYDSDWQAARAKAEALASANGTSLTELAKISGLEVATDFHKVLNAGELAFADIKPHAALYNLMNIALKDRRESVKMSAADAKKPSSDNPAGLMFRARFKPLFLGLSKVANAAPNRNFVVDLLKQSVEGVIADKPINN